MRHIFDQYEQDENKLTHALVSSLAQDEVLLRKFIQWAVKKSIPQKTKIHVLEQSVPGQEEELSEEVPEKKGLPDAWFYTDDGWNLIIESKVESKLSLNQIARHRKRAGSDAKIQMVIILLEHKDVVDATVLTWRDIYDWGMRHKKQSKWAGLFTEYFEIVEAKMVQKGYLKKGTITKFTGIPFCQDYPYTYLQAKRLLKLITDELRRDKELTRDIGIDPALDGRSAITGKDGLQVWDFLRLKESRRAKSHTEYPHLMISIGNESANVAITIPNGVNSEIRGRLFDLKYEDFEGVFLKFLKISGPSLKLDKHIKPYVNVVQRHYFTQRSMPVKDAFIEFDLRTSFPNKGHEKYQSQWLRTVYDVMRSRQANLQMQVGFKIDYSLHEKWSIIRSSDGIKFFKCGAKNLGVVLGVLFHR